VMFQCRCCCRPRKAHRQSLDRLCAHADRMNISFGPAVRPRDRFSAPVGHDDMPSVLIARINQLLVPSNAPALRRYADFPLRKTGRRSKEVERWCAFDRDIGDVGQAAQSDRTGGLRRACRKVTMFVGILRDSATRASPSDAEYQSLNDLDAIAQSQTTAREQPG